MLNKLNSKRLTYSILFTLCLMVLIPGVAHGNILDDMNSNSNVESGFNTLMAEIFNTWLPAISVLALLSGIFMWAVLKKDIQDTWMRVIVGIFLASSSISIVSWLYSTFGPNIGG